MVLCGLIAVLMLGPYRSLAEQPIHKGKPFTKWLEELQDTQADSSVRIEAAQAIAEMRLPASLALEALTNTLDDEAGLFTAPMMIGSALDHGVDDISPFVDALRNPNLRVRRASVFALYCVEPPPESATSELIKTIHDEDRDVRSGAAGVLGRLKSKKNEVTPALLELLKDPDAGLRADAADSLGKLGRATQETVNQLVIALKDQDARVRQNAIGALPKLGGEARKASPAIIECLKDPERNVRYYAAHAIVDLKLKVSAAIPQLIAIADNKHEDEFLRSAAISALGFQGSAARDAIPMLTRLIEDSELPMRFDAAAALWEINGDTKTAIRAAIDVLKDERGRMNREAARLLGKIGSEAKEAVPLLVEMAVDSFSPDDRRAATKAVLRIDPETAANAGLK